MNPQEETYIIELMNLKNSIDIEQCLGLPCSLRFAIGALVKKGKNELTEMKVIRKILFFIFTMIIITVGEIKSSTVVAVLQEETPSSFIQKESVEKARCLDVVGDNTQNISRLLIGSADLLALGISTGYCKDNNSEFCQAYREYELCIGLGLLGASAITNLPNIYNRLKSGYDNLPSNALSPDQKRFVENVLEVGVTRIIPKSVDEIKHLLKTDKNTAFFWSGSTNGIGGETRALEIAKSRGGITLEGLLKGYARLD